MTMQTIRSARRAIVAALAVAAFGPLAAIAAEDVTRDRGEERVPQRQEAQNPGEVRERARTGEDNDRGQGEMRRERERAERRDAGGYGRGYEARQGGGMSGSRGMGGGRR